MTNPTFGGFAIFGRSVRVRTLKDPSAEQINHFFGLDGAERVHGGLVGRHSFVQGVLRGLTSGDLATARLLIEGYDDGIARTLVDTLGITWTNVVFRQLDPGERIVRDNFGHYLPYRATLRHLS